MPVLARLRRPAREVICVRPVYGSWSHCAAGFLGSCSRMAFGPRRPAPTADRPRPMDSGPYVVTAA
eukprot:9405482-Pyramimonas_sp.AAC.1